MSFEAAYSSALSTHLLSPGVALLASNTDGTFQYTQHLGVRSLDPSSPSFNHLFDSSTLLRLASCTKLLTSIAILQCLERGLLSLDADISPILPELSKLPVVSLDSNNSTVLTPSRTPITLRHLLTHTAGVFCPSWSTALQVWIAEQSDPTLGKSGGVAARFGKKPLANEPGTSWAYGSGLDWAGRAVAIVSGVELETYMAENIFKPLGVDGFAFWPARRPELVKDLADVYARDPASGLAVRAKVDMFPAVDDSVTEELGGRGGFARVGDYFAVLKAILRDDGTLLRSETMATLFEPQLGMESREVLMELAPRRLKGFDGHVDASRYGLDHGLGGMLCSDDIPGFKGANTLQWVGWPGLEWFVDRKNGLCGFVAAQLYHTGDEVMTGLHREWTYGIYQRYIAWKAGQNKGHQ